MSERYGGNPLSMIRRVPTEWCQILGLPSAPQLKNAPRPLKRAGRKSFIDRFPEGMDACKSDLVKFYEEARSRTPPYSPSIVTLFNTWHSIVKKLKYNQKQKAEERKDPQRSKEGENLPRAS